MGTSELTLNVWRERCTANSGSPDTWTNGKGKTFMFKPSARKHEDGSLTGYILLKNEAGEFERVGQFRISPTGETTLAPKFLRVISEAEAAPVTETVVESAPLPEATVTSETLDPNTVEDIEELSADENEFGSQY